MKEKKNIDRLFQEQLRDFEAIPDNQVWLNIEAELKKDKKRKIIPLWLKYSGIAAAFLLGFLTLNTNKTFKLKPKNDLVLNTKIPKDSSNTKLFHPTKSSKKPQVVNNSKENGQYKKEIIATNFSESKTKTGKDNTSKGSLAATVYNKRKQNDAEVLRPKNNLKLKPSATNEGNTNFGLSNVEKNSVGTTNSVVTIPNPSKENNTLAEKEDAKKQLSNNLESPNELEKILKTATAPKKAVASHSKNKWQITPNIAPIYLNTNSGGSPIDEQLSDYEKKSDKSLSFGIGVQYAAGKKIVIRTGINKVVLGYSTNNVLYSAGLTANNLRNIEYFPNNAVEIVNKANYSLLTTPEKQIQNTNTGSLNQKMGYYELPMEVSYAILNKKFGINLIGGFSTFFLNENTISLVSPQSNIELGEANNLNQVHFSSNVGLGFKYQFSKSFQINVEPLLKYQLNTFSNNSADFKPLFIGLYSGISYGF